jgi:predicted DNA-binding transcriptional regulator AlpA
MTMPPVVHRNKRDIPAALRTFDSLPDAAHVRVPVVAALYGVAIMTVYRWSASGRLPAPIKLGPGVTAWNVGQLRRAREAIAGQAATTSRAPRRQKRPAAAEAA